MTQVRRYRLERLPTPGVVKSDMDRIRKVAAALEGQAILVLEMYEALYDASLSELHGGDGVQAGKTSVRKVHDPTYDVATSAIHNHLRRQAHNVALKLRRMDPILAEAENLIVSAFNQLDPEFRAKWLRLLREIEATE